MLRGIKEKIQNKNKMGSSGLTNAYLRTYIHYYGILQIPRQIAELFYAQGQGQCNMVPWMKARGYYPLFARIIQCSPLLTKYFRGKYELKQ